MPVNVEAHDLRKSYPDARGALVDVLHGVSLAIGAGEMVSIVGPSGSGKSTLLYVLSGLEAADGGTSSIGGIDLASLTPAKLARFRRKHVGFVFQSYNLIPALTVSENVALPLRLAHGKAPDAEVLAALSSVGLADFADRRPGSLSGGQQQRVAIARVLAAQPDVVFADEPTGALDTVNGSAVLDLLGRYSADGRSVVMVTHDLDAAARADRVLVLRDGRIHAELDHPDARAVFDAVAATSEADR
jgi:putative ABC transport system ATP-binding protein